MRDNAAPIFHADRARLLPISAAKKGKRGRRDAAAAKGSVRAFPKGIKFNWKRLYNSTVKTKGAVCYHTCRSPGKTHEEESSQRSSGGASGRLASADNGAGRGKPCRDRGHPTGGLISNGAGTPTIEKESLRYEGAGNSDGDNTSYTFTMPGYAATVTAAFGRTETAFVPRATATRGEAAAMTQRFCESLEK